MGDAILSAIVGEKLYKLFPFKDEGWLTEMRAKMVSRQQLCKIGKKWGIISFIKYDKSIVNQGKFYDTMIGDVMESLIGAIYIDKGYKFTKKFVENKIIGNQQDIQQLMENELSYKAKLNRLMQNERRVYEFKILGESQLNKVKLYEIALYINNEEILKTSNHSKKAAEEYLSEKWFKLKEN